MSEPVLIATGKPDAEVAAEMKESLRTQLEKVCEILTQINRAGFVATDRKSVV